MQPNLQQAVTVSIRYQHLQFIVTHTMYKLVNIIRMKTDEYGMKSKSRWSVVFCYVDA